MTGSTLAEKMKLTGAGVLTVNGNEVRTSASSGYFQRIRTSATFDATSNGTTEGSVTCSSSIADGDVLAIEVSSTSSTTAASPKILMVTIEAGGTTPPAGLDYGHGWSAGNSAATLSFYGFQVSASGTTLSFDNSYLTSSGAITTETAFTLYVRNVWRLT
jgi:hypothetical protein